MVRIGPIVRIPDHNGSHVNTSHKSLKRRLITRGSPYSPTTAFCLLSALLCSSLLPLASAAFDSIVTSDTDWNLQLSSPRAWVSWKKSKIHISESITNGRQQCKITGDNIISLSSCQSICLQSFQLHPTPRTEQSVSQPSSPAHLSCCVIDVLEPVWPKVDAPVPPGQVGVTTTTCHLLTTTTTSITFSTWSRWSILPPAASSPSSSQSCTSTPLSVSVIL